MPKLDWRVLALSLGAFLALSYCICVLGDLLLGHGTWRGWVQLLPISPVLNWRNFLIGLVATFAYGVYAALVFVPLYNFFLSRMLRKRDLKVQPQSDTAPSATLPKV